MRFLTRNTFAVPVIVFMAAVLFDENAPSYTQIKSIPSKTKQIITGTASPLFQTNSRINLAITCFPRHLSSRFNGEECNTRVEVGPVIVFDATYKVSSKEQCAYILSTKVRSALRSNFYEMCLSGAFI